MNRILKFNRDQKILFISDLHLGHERDFVLKPRWDALPEETRERLSRGFQIPEGGYWNAEQFYQWFQDEWDNKDTIVFNLGDVCFNDPKGERFHEVTKLPCKKHYVLWGNHNSGMKNVYQSAKTICFKSLDEDYPQEAIDALEVYPLNYNNITFVGREMTIMVGKKEIHLSHFAKRLWDHSSRGSWNIHGHSHGSDKSRNIGAVNGGKGLDVGIENAIAHNGSIGFTFHELYDIMKERDILVLDHHNGTEAPSN